MVHMHVYSANMIGKMNKSVLGLDLVVVVLADYNLNCNDFISEFKPRISK